MAGLLGAYFGFMLSWTRFVDYDVITAALRFENFYLWGMFVSGTATAFLGLQILKSLKVKTLAGRSAVRWERSKVRREHLIGGAIFGVGWAITGTCPGPAIAQIGLLHFAGIFTLAGIMIGIELQDRMP
jgi:uncharacterized membrane protein YedE/YeeE